MTGEIGFLTWSVGISLVLGFALAGAWWGRLWGERIEDLGLDLLRRQGEVVPELPETVVQEWEDFRSCWKEVREKTEKVFQAQKDFTANAAHELRTPLAALRITGEGLFQGEPGLEGVRETVGAMLEEAERVGRLVDQLLMLARAESGRIAVEADYHPLADIIGVVVEVRQILAEDRGQKLLFSKDGDWSVWADRNLLRLAVDNVVANALRYSPEKTVIEVRIHRCPEGGVAVTVQDEGPGLRKGEESAVFERFYRGGGAVSESGFGLGLSIARWGIEAFGGNLQAANREKGKGAVFTVLCPETEWDHFADSRTETTGGSWQNPEEEWAMEAAPGQVLAKMESSPRGLDEETVALRREIVGANRFQALRKNPLWHLFRRACQTPFNGILLVCLGLSWFLGETQPAIVMGLMVLLSTGLRFWQEKKILRGFAGSGKRGRGQGVRGPSGKPWRNQRGGC